MWKTEIPYLAEANCRINNVSYLNSDMKFAIEYSAIVDQIIQLSVILPLQLKKSELNGLDVLHISDKLKPGGIYTYKLNIKTTRMNNELVFHFK